jgi:hypothetical protein
LVEVPPPHPIFWFHRKDGYGSRLGSFCEFSWESADLQGFCGEGVVDLVTVTVFDSRQEAERIQEFLTSRGIVSYVFADDCGGFRPYLGFTTGGYRLQIHRDDCDRAGDFLRELL